MTSRSLVTLLLVAALISVVVFGVVNWRSTVEPSPAPVPAVPVATVRPQLGRAAHTLAVKPPRSAHDEPAASGMSAPEEPPPHGAAASPSTTLGRLLAMVRSDPAPPVAEPARQPTMSAGLGSSAPSSGPPAVTAALQSAASDALATVQFVGLMQDQQLLERDDFWAQTLRELKITVWWNVAGPQTQRLELFAPDGSLYRRFSTTFDAAASGKTSVETPLPVGGTWITEYSLYGAWRVDVYLAGQSKPITSASFVLNP